MDSMFSYDMMEEMVTSITTGQMIYNVSVNILNIVGYVLLALSLYTIAKRRGIANPWLAWVPVAQIWVLGSISDQFRYVTKAQVKNKRTTLLVMCIIYTVALAVLIVAALIGITRFVEFAMYAAEEEMTVQAMSLFLKLFGAFLLLMGLALAYMIIYFIALYDVFMSVNPGNAVLFLVLSILFSITEPFFIFFNRKKDTGMPPRCDVPQAPVAYSYIPEAMAQEPAETAEEPVAEEPEVPAEEPTEQTEE